MSISDISNRLSETITKEIALNDEKKEILSYAVETALLSIAGTLLVIVVSYLFHVLFPALIGVFFGGTLRRLSGGAHFNTPLKCLLFGAIIYTLIGFLAQQFSRLEIFKTSILLFLIIFSLLSVGLLAPVESHGKPIHSKRLKIKLKLLSILLILIVLTILCLNRVNLFVTGSVLGITYQCITLLPIFNRREVI